MNSTLRDLLASVRLADIADVLLLTAFLYVGIGWLRRSSSGSAARRLVALAVVFALVYTLVGTFDLYLMEWLLSGLLIVALVAGVVLFQADLRRLLDRIANWSIAGGGATASPVSPVEIVVEAAARLADSRTGALIAIRGREPWTGHFQGGVELGGRVSRPLLYSIFHPDSPGHDGAVLMEGDRVTHFAAHLPLATQLPEVSRFGGTRHAAALGLAEACDALVVVVSEERGTISVAQDARLEEVDSPAELGQRLQRFWSEHHAPAAEGAGWWTRRAVESASMALALAASAWLVFSYSGDTVYRSFDVPIEFRNLPEGWALQRDTALTALVTVAGSENAFRRLDSTQLAISFDLAQPRAGTNELRITEEQLRLPSGLRLYDVNPRELAVGVDRQVAVELPVRIRTLGPLADSLMLLPDPDRVTVLASGDTAGLPDHLLTEPVDTRRLQSPGGLRARLVLPPGVRLRAEQEPEVGVRVVRRAGLPPA